MAESSNSSFQNGFGESSDELLVVIALAELLTVILLELSRMFSELLFPLLLGMAEEDETGMLEDDETVSGIVPCEELLSTLLLEMAEEDEAGLSKEDDAGMSRDDETVSTGSLILSASEHAVKQAIIPDVTNAKTLKKSSFIKTDIPLWD